MRTLRRSLKCLKYCWMILKLLVTRLSHSIIKLQIIESCGDQEENCYNGNTPKSVMSEWPSSTSRRTRSVQVCSENSLNEKRTCAFTCTFHFQGWSKFARLMVWFILKNLTFKKTPEVFKNAIQIRVFHYFDTF